MICIDPSSALAVLKEEADALIYRDRIAVASAKFMTVVGKVEAAVSMGRVMQDHEHGTFILDRFCQEAGITTVPINVDLYPEVMLAYRRYGKGTGHPAQLNFGDCFSYAYAKKNNLQLLYKGNDFSRTDIESAL